MINLTTYSLPLCLVYSFIPLFFFWGLTLLMSLTHWASQQLLSGLHRFAFRVVSVGMSVCVLASFFFKYVSHHFWSNRIFSSLFSSIYFSWYSIHNATFKENIILNDILFPCIACGGLFPIHTNSFGKKTTTRFPLYTCNSIQWQQCCALSAQRKVESAYKKLDFARRKWYKHDEFR